MLKIKFYRKNDCRVDIPNTWITRFKLWLLYKLNKTEFWHVNVEIDDQCYDMFAGTSFRPRSKRVIEQTYGHATVTYSFWDDDGGLCGEVAEALREAGDIELLHSAWDCWRGKLQTPDDAHRSCVSSAVLLMNVFGVETPPMVMTIDELQKVCEENCDGRIHVLGGK